jgi:hypothetical protein
MLAAIYYFTNIHSVPVMMSSEQRVRISLPLSLPSSACSVTDIVLHWALLRWIDG